MATAIDMYKRNRNRTSSSSVDPLNGELMNALQPFIKSASNSSSSSSSSVPQIPSFPTYPSQNPNFGYISFDQSPNFYHQNQTFHLSTGQFALPNLSPDQIHQIQAQFQSQQQQQHHHLYAPNHDHLHTQRRLLGPKSQPMKPLLPPKPTKLYRGVRQRYVTQEISRSSRPFDGSVARAGAVQLHKYIITASFIHELNIKISYCMLHPHFVLLVEFLSREFSAHSVEGRCSEAYASTDEPIPVPVAPQFALGIPEELPRLIRKGERYSL
ncbi:ethylene-responsive transcription factor RAP2-4-like [Asparagus officinalis]|uniref:ethylene-responsive transcription factor RAP2-4-like n=1 Tax=Asparagus officinalis TaxID=4686 RepID=UPI00098E3953|nr:ethylene-responsive transcription factor RAP2-4-like [Asparagus officinalis]